jgi:hypothetical protein
MNRDQLELVLTREGLTQPQTRAVLDAADQYATSQAKAAIDALGWQTIDASGYRPPDVHYLAGARTACGQPNQNLLNTTIRGRVTCGACRKSPAWKATT